MRFPSTLPLLSAALLYLAQVANTRSSNDEAIFDATFALFVGYPHERDVQVGALEALARVFMGRPNVTIARRFADAGGIDAVLLCLERFETDLDVQASGAMALAELARAHFKHQSQIGRVGALEWFLAQMRTFPSEAARKAGLGDTVRGWPCVA